MTAVLEEPVRARGSGAGWLLLATSGAGVVNYGYALLLTHGLAPTQYAAFAAGQALLMVRAAVSGAGVPWLLARELSRRPDDRRWHVTVTSFAFWANVALGTALTVPVTGAVLIFGDVRDAAVVACASLLMSMGSTGMGFLQGAGRMELMAALLTLEAVIKAGTGIALVFACHLGSAGALAGFVAGSAVLLIPVPMFRRLVGRPRWRAAEAGLCTAVLRQTRMQASVAVTAAGDTVLVGVLGLGPAGGAPYQAASALGRVPLFAANAVSTAVFPQLSRDGSAERKAGALRTYLLVGTAMTGVLVTLPPELRSVLFPDTFAAVGRWLPYAAILGLLIGLFNLCVTFLQAEDGHRHTARLLTGITVAYLGTVTSAATVAGVPGLARSAVVAGALAVVTLSMLPAVRPGWHVLIASRRDLGAVAGVLAFAGVLAVVGDPVLWSGIAVLGGLTVLASSFPELLPRRRR
ncbi:lipopolysaccharide biosynthesis protein [Actinoplanes sp. RD1]|uniref:lipopolysaccharide biosynthesis protein n=1 Tax=Actinoplanes sp. RD1 TaxID=3064538 RepID=UPI002741CF0A|nr:lipopolysaccharide biosynthesis protein [Actinoplanes sp. RD1]